MLAFFLSNACPAFAFSPFLCLLNPDNVALRTARTCFSPFHFLLLYFSVCCATHGFWSLANCTGGCPCYLVSIGLCRIDPRAFYLTLEIGRAMSSLKICPLGFFIHPCYRNVPGRFQIASFPNHRVLHWILYRHSDLQQLPVSSQPEDLNHDAMKNHCNVDSNDTATLFSAINTSNHCSSRLCQRKSLKKRSRSVWLLPPWLGRIPVASGTT